MKLNVSQMKIVKTAIWRAINWTEAAIESEESVIRYYPEHDRGLRNREKRYLRKLIKLESAVDAALEARAREGKQ